MFEALVQVTVLDKVDLRYLSIHFALVIDELQDGQFICVLVTSLSIVLHCFTCAIRKDVGGS